jgi:hypothetical protein
MMSKHGVHKNPFLGWNPPAEDSAWARAEAERRGVALSVILTEALGEYRAKHSAKHQDGPVSPSRARKPRADTAPPVKPKTAPKGKCEHRVPAGAYCRTCGKLKEG